MESAVNRSTKYKFEIASCSCVANSSFPFDSIVWSVISATVILYFRATFVDGNSWTKHFVYIRPLHEVLIMIEKSSSKLLVHTSQIAFHHFRTGIVIENMWSHVCVCVCNVHWPSIRNHIFHSIPTPFTMANRLRNFRMNQNNGQWAQGLCSCHALAVTHSFAQSWKQYSIWLVTFIPFIVRFRAIVCWCFPLCTSFTIVFRRCWSVDGLVFGAIICMGGGRGQMHFQPKEMTEALTCWICLPALLYFRCRCVLLRCSHLMEWHFATNSLKKCTEWRDQKLKEKRNRSPRRILSTFCW